MGFLSTLQQNFLGLLVCNARKREQSRKTAINFPSDDRLGPVFFCLNKNDKIYAMGHKFSLFDLHTKLHKKRKRFPGPEQSNGMDSASAVASPSSLLTPMGQMEHDLLHFPIV